MNSTNNSWLHLIRATGYSLAGLRTTFNNEPAFRQELLVLLLVIPLAFWLGESGVDYVLLIGSWLLVIMVELLNTAVEAVVNRVGSEHTELAGRAGRLAPWSNRALDSGTMDNSEIAVYFSTFHF